MKKIIRKCVLCTCILLSIFYQSFSSTKDSLSLIWNNHSKSKTLRFDALEELIFEHYAFIDSDSTFILANQHLELAKSHKDIPHQVISNYILGLAYIHIDSTQQAIYHLEKSLELIEECDRWDLFPQVMLNLLGAHSRTKKAFALSGMLEAKIRKFRAQKNDKAIVAGLNVAASIYYVSNQEAKALETFIEFYPIINKIKDEKFTQLKEDGLAVILYSSNQFDKAEELYQKLILRHKKAGKFTGLSFAYLSLGNIYLKKENHIKSEEFYLKGLELSKKAKLHYVELRFNRALGELYKTNGEIKKAIQIFERLLRLSILRENDPFILYSQSELGLLYLDQGNLKKTYEFCSTTYTIADEALEPSTKRNAAECLYKYYEQTKEKDKAYEYLKKYIGHDNYFRNEKRTRMITSISMQSEFRKKITQHRIEMAKESLVQKLLLGGLAVLGIFSFLVYRSYRIKNKANKKITEQKKELEALNHTKDRIFAIIGHDLRKPAIAFRGITKKVNYLLKKQQYDRLNILGREIENDALALNKLTDNLLNWALSQKNALTVSPQQVYIASIVEDTFAIFNRIAKDKKVFFTSNVAEDLTAYADHNTLQTIIRNVVDNALKYTPSNGIVSVEAVHNNSEVSISITDTGVGIPTDKIHQLFELQKGKSEDGTNGEKGTGLGLHLVHELVKLNQGSIEVISELHKGSTFKIVLPKNAP